MTAVADRETEPEEKNPVWNPSRTSTFRVDRLEIIFLGRVVVGRVRDGSEMKV